MIIGRQNLPSTSRIFGHQIGRFVGILQQSHQHFSSFARQNELQKLQQELRVGLRELDRVKSEVAGSMRLQRELKQPSHQIQPTVSPNNVPVGTASSSDSYSNTVPYRTTNNASTEKQRAAAVAEFAWKQQKIDFQATGEMTHKTTGSTLLSQVIQESLIHDQYDEHTKEHS